MIGAEAIVKCLEKEKVDVIFGEPFFLDTKEQNGQNKMEYLSQEIIDSIYKLNSNSDSEG